VETWGDIRLKARTCHAQAMQRTKGQRDGRALVNAALIDNDLELHPSSAQLKGGILGSLEREAKVVNIAKGQDPKEEVVVIAHEIGHFVLHTDPSNEVTVISPSLGGDPADTGAAKVEGYSPRERKEVQADIFAGEFLCPSDWLRSELLNQNKSPADVANELGLPYKLVLHQAIRALLLPPLRPPKTEEAGPSVALDDSQNEAATWSKGPLLVDAGPGTGKTRTLVHRIGHVLKTNGGKSGAILALTFSNKAAEEMRTRLAATHQDAAIEMWVGTFHAFGKELVSKWASRLGRTENVKILDEVGQLAVLESNLPRLPLKHYQNLYEPAFELVPVLRAISRCKDELVTWRQYLAEAEKARAQASSPDTIEAAERAVEIGHIYKIYQEALEAADAVDFGDLIMLSVELLEKDADARTDCHARFRHLLVDEYQDVNFASARLLHLLGQGTTDVWVVADQRQSIYRFRGAKPDNVARFAKDFSGQRQALSTNYRSGEQVVQAFAAFTHHMASDPSAAASWNAHRGPVGGVTLTVAPTVAGEAAAIRDQIESFKTAGIDYADQIILARSHLTLSRITDVLSQLGVPLLYLGDLFERPEVCDLLALLSIDAEFGGLGLLRVAQLPEYDVPKNDILKVIAWAEAKKSTLVEGLGKADEIEGLSQEGLTGIKKLGSHLHGFGPGTSPWTMLTAYLFERSNYLRTLIQKNTPDTQQQLIAIYQLLKTVGAISPGQDSSRRHFLERVRRLESLNQDQSFRIIPSEAADFDAVRVMTLHGSKGLEFRAVHLPAIATRYMPANRQWDRCPPPPALAHLAMQTPDHDAEEECLFFVGMSRARDYLSLSRADKYTKQSASPSKFLASISGVVKPKQAGDHILPESGRTTSPMPARDAYDERELDIYLRCPARYRYEYVDGLKGGSEGSAYLRFHRAVHRTLDWMEQQQTAGRVPSLEEVRGELATFWQTVGPRQGAGFEPYYRNIAETMVTSVHRLLAQETGTYDREPWSVELNGRTIELTPDRVILESSGAVRVQRLKTGRKSKSEPDHRIYALIRLGAAQRYPGRSVIVETYYPGLDEAVPVAAKSDEKLLKEYTDAIRSIELGDFPAEPDEARYCPNCPTYFTCDGR
jgi:DNA helicase-2/ATP-dependent DNA helicase PcrA